MPFPRSLEAPSSPSLSTYGEPVNGYLGEIVGEGRVNRSVEDKAPWASGYRLSARHGWSGGAVRDAGLQLEESLWDLTEVDEPSCAGNGVRSSSRRPLFRHNEARQRASQSPSLSSIPSRLSTTLASRGVFQFGGGPGPLLGASGLGPEGSRWSCWRLHWGTFFLRNNIGSPERTLLCC
jgi:hypothetical protein